MRGTGGERKKGGGREVRAGDEGCRDNSSARSVLACSRLHCHPVI